MAWAIPYISLSLQFCDVTQLAVGEQPQVPPYLELQPKQLSLSPNLSLSLPLSEGTTYVQSCIFSFKMQCPTSPHHCFTLFSVLSLASGLLGPAFTSADLYLGLLIPRVFTSLVFLQASFVLSWLLLAPALPQTFIIFISWAQPSLTATTAPPLHQQNPSGFSLTEPVLYIPARARLPSLSCSF